MDVKSVNPFVEAFGIVMPQLGFGNLRRGDLKVKDKELTNSGVTIMVGIIGEQKGNVAYTIGAEEAKKIASTMMMGMPVDEIDEMAKSALSELANMLTANAATCFSNVGISIDISTPILLHGDNVTVKMSSDKVICLQIITDEIPIDINIAFEN